MKVLPLQLQLKRQTQLPQRRNRKIAQIVRRAMSVVHVVVIVIVAAITVAKTAPNVVKAVANKRRVTATVRQQMQHQQPKQRCASTHRSAHPRQHRHMCRSPHPLRHPS